MSLFGFVLLHTMFLPLLSQNRASIEGVTFASKPQAIYVPIRELAGDLSVSVEYDPKTHQLAVDGKMVDDTRALYDGTTLLPLDDLTTLGASTQWDPEAQTATATLNGKSATIILKPKRVTIDLGDQRLDAYQGDFLVLHSRVSTGKEGKTTPSGQFKVGPVKQKLHRSKLYDNAPMPWSVQVNGNVFIHGFKSVPHHPASHGCIRMPISAAHWFYQWVDIGTPVEIKGQWQPKAKTTQATPERPPP